MSRGPGTIDGIRCLYTCLHSSCSCRYNKRVHKAQSLSTATTVPKRSGARTAAARELTSYEGEEVSDDEGVIEDDGVDEDDGEASDDKLTASGKIQLWTVANCAYSGVQL